MRYRYLGRSGLKVTEFIYGNWLTHGGEVDDETAIACVHAAQDAGITTFDTADVYANGAAETVLGSALRGQRRESLEIFSKVYFPTGPKGPNDCGLSRKHILESLEGTLRRLGTDHLDLYQAHRFDPDTPLEETMQAFADVVRSGKALYIGVSEWNADQLRAGKALADQLGIQLISNQPQYSLLWRVIEPRVMPTGRDLGISQIVWSPLAQGVLTGKYRPGQPVPAGSRATDATGGGQQAIGPFLADATLRAVAGLHPIADRLGISMAQLALAWVLSHEDVAGAILGASRPEQITQNVAATDVRLDASTIAEIERITEPVAVLDPDLTRYQDERPA